MIRRQSSRRFRSAIATAMASITIKLRPARVFTFFLPRTRNSSRIRCRRGDRLFTLSTPELVEPFPLLGLTGYGNITPRIISHVEFDYQSIARRAATGNRLVFFEATEQARLLWTAILQVVSVPTPEDHWQANWA